MMKRWLALIALTLVAAIGSYSVFAQPGGGMGRGMMQGQGGMMCPMCGAMSGAMLQKSVVQAEDGIIVAIGNKLIKYDNDLNKVKEATIDIDISGMQQIMQQAMQNCPMHQQMMQRSQQQAQEAP